MPSMGQPKSLENNGPRGQSGRRPGGLPERANARSSTSSAHLFDRSARFGHRPPPGGPSDRKAWPKMLVPTPTLRLRPGTRRKPAYRSSPTGVARADWSHPIGDARSEGTRGEWRRQRTKSNHDTRTIPCTPAEIVLHDCPNTSSIVGADICVYSIVGAVGLPYGKKHPMPLGIDRGRQDPPYLVHVVGLLTYQQYFAGTDVHPS